MRLRRSEIREWVRICIRCEASGCALELSQGAVRRRPSPAESYETECMRDVESSVSDPVHGGKLAVIGRRRWDEWSAKGRCCKECDRLSHGMAKEVVGKDERGRAMLSAFGCCVGAFVSPQCIHVRLGLAQSIPYRRNVFRICHGHQGCAFCACRPGSLLTSSLRSSFDVRIRAHLSSGGYF